MSFWLLAIAMPTLAGLALCWPLLRQGGPWLISGASLLLLIPMATLVLYQGVGTPQGIGVKAGPAIAATGETDVETLLAQLRERLAEEPDNLEGWMLLGRSLKSLQRYPAARDALRQAQSLAPDDPVVQVELAEALIFSAGQGQATDPEVRELLDAALATEPRLQKGLWLLGVTDFQAGDYQDAINSWETLLPLLPPGSGVAGSVEKQLAEARARVGISTPATGAWPGIAIAISSTVGSESVPESAVLYVIARDPAAPAPPLGVVRVPRPVFPVTVTLDDSNSMMPTRPVSGANQLEVLARLSLTGEPLPGADDPASEAVIVPTSSGNAPVELVIHPPQP